MQSLGFSVREARSQLWLLLLFLSFIFLPFDLLSAQVGSAKPSENDTLSVQIAGVRRLIKEIHSSHDLGELKTVCIYLQEDGKWLEEEEVGRNQLDLEWVLREELNLRVAPRASCVKGGESFTRPERLFRDAETGEAAAFLRISEPTFESPTQARLSVGYHFGPLWGQGFRGDLELSDDGWSITDWRPTWQS